MTIQAGSKDPPKTENETLALIIICPECRTQRAFQIQHTLAEIVNRSRAGAEYISECSDCKHQFKVQLLWAHRKFGWTRKKIDVENRVEVIDDMGLEEQT